MNAAFVAEARRSNRGVMKWMRANGWNFRNMLSPDGLTTLHYDEVTDRTGHVHPKIIVHSHMTGFDETCHPTSIAHALNFLVDAGVLPDEFHSLSATGSYDDPAGTRAYFADREPSWCLCGGPFCDGKAATPCPASPVMAAGGAA